MKKLLNIISTLLIVLAPVTFLEGANTRSSEYVDGNSEYLSIADASQTGLDITGDFTIRLFVKFDVLPVDTGSNTSRLVSKWAGTNERSYIVDVLRSGGNEQGRIITSSNGTDVNQCLVDTGGTLSTGTWYEFLFQYDASAGQGEFFIDGTSQGTCTGLHTSIADDTADFTVGAADGGGDDTDGHIDDVVVFSDLLTSDEIDSITGCVFDSHITDNLQGYWKMDEASGTRTDSSANGNDLSDNNTVGSDTDVPFTDSCAAAPAGGQIINFTLFDWIISWLVA